jgi:FecR protein/SPOR domain
MSISQASQPPLHTPDPMGTDAVDQQRRQSSMGVVAWLALRAVPLPLAGAVVALATHSPAQGQGVSTAVVELLRAPAWIESAVGRLPLAAGALVGPLQTVVTGDNARLVLKLPEGSLIALGANSRLTIEALAYGQSEGNSVLDAAFRAVVGTLRYVTALTEKLNGRNRKVSISTATATIGIRGTRFWAQSTAQQEIVCLFEGKVDISRANEPLAVLDAPNAFWTAPAGQAALPVGIATPDQLRSFGGQVAAPEGSGLAKPGGTFSIATSIWLESRAKALAQRLAQLGFVASVTPCASGAAHVFDVTVSSLASADDARAVAAQLAALVQHNFELVQAAR